MSSSANQPVWVGSSERWQLRPHPHEAEAGGAKQVLDGAARDRVRAERPDVELDRTARLIAVGKHERPRLVRRGRDRGDVVAVPGAVRDRRAADKRRPLVDRLGEPLGVDRPVGPGPDVHDLGAAQLLRVRDLPNRRKLVLADHDPVPLPVERQRGDKRAHTLRDRRRHRDVVGPGVEEPRDRRPERLVPLDPEVPLGPVRVPAGEPPLHRLPHALRKGPLRARVEIGRALEDRELAPDRGTEPRCDVDPGRARHPCSSYRLGGVVTPKNRATPAPAFRNEWGTSER